jgi:hypothetical protein
LIKDKLTYSIYTLSGELPTFSDRAMVYKITYQPTTLLNADIADRKAEAISFVDATNIPVSHQAINPTLFKWEATNAQGFRRSLTMNIETYNFTMFSNYLVFPPIVNSTDIANPESAKYIAGEYLRVMGLLPGDLDPTKTTAELLSIKSATLIPASRTSTAQIIRVNFFQKDIGDPADTVNLPIPIVYANYPHSSLDIFITSRSTDITDVVEARYTYQHIDDKEPASYDLKTAEEAYKELVDGKAFISNYNAASKTVRITDVYLAYFAQSVPQKYLLPVIVFKGEGDFYGFVSAIKDEWIDKATASTPTPTLGSTKGSFPTSIPRQ